VEIDNPWGASTLEWSIASPAPEHNFAGQARVIYRGAYELAPPPAQEFVPQHLSPELLAQNAR